MSRRMLLLFAAVFAAAQQVEPVYRTGTQLVQVDVVVRNDKGPVKGLTKDDFTLLDKGKPQTIAVFAMNERGGDTAKAAPLPPNVVSNRINSSGAERAEPATVILFDRLNILEPRATRATASWPPERKPGRAARFWQLLASLKPLGEGRLVLALSGSHGGAGFHRRLRAAD